MFKINKIQLEEVILPWIFPLLAIVISLSIGIFFTFGVQIVLFIFWIAVSWFVFGEGDFFADPLPTLSVGVVFISLVIGNIGYLIFSNFDMISNIQILR